MGNVGSRQKMFRFWFMSVTTGRKNYVHSPSICPVSGPWNLCLNLYYSVRYYGSQCCHNACCCWSSCRAGIQTLLSHGNQKWNVLLNTYFEQNCTKGKNITGFATGRTIKNLGSNMGITDAVLFCRRKGAVTCFSKIDDVAMFVTHKNIISL